MNKRDLRLDKYGISKKRYKELCGFCEQYPEWKSAIKDYSLVKGISYDPVPKSVTNEFHSQVEDAAIRNEKYMANCELIESVAKQTDAEWWQYIIDSVCYEVPLNYLITVKGMNLSQFPFYKKRRYFFYLLDKAKK